MIIARPARRHSSIAQSRGRIAIVLAVVVGLVGAAAITFAIAVSGRSVPRAATLLPEPVPLPAIELAHSHGGRLTRDWFEGKHTLVFFGFTHCPDVCPITLQQLAAARRRLSDQGIEILPSILFVSVDPQRDDLAAVTEYVAAFGDGVSGARGDLAALESLTRTLGVYHARERSGDDYTVDHSAAVFVIDDAARFRAVFSAPHDVADLVHDWPIVVAAS